MSNFFLFKTFCKRNDAKIIFLIIFYFLIIFFLVSNSFTKEKRIYVHILYIIIYVYIYLYTFLYEKFFSRESMYVMRGQRTLSGYVQFHSQRVCFVFYEICICFDRANILQIYHEKRTIICWNWYFASINSDFCWLMFEDWMIKLTIETNIQLFTWFSTNKGTSRSILRF